MNVCTIIAKNYLAHARVLGRSLRAHDPEARLWTLILDDFEHYVDPAQEPFEVLTPAQVGCEQFTQMALRYSVLELSTAVKPWLLRHLMAQTGGPVTYLDPDIKVFGSLHTLDELAAEHGLVLTPHNSQPIPPDGRRPGQVDIMIAGVYNLGYVSLAPRPEIESLLDWWADRLLRDCRVDPIWGYFVDQRWFDLAPGLVSDLAILRDPEFNLAYWNLHSRQLERRGDQYAVNGRPLAFFHFSGFNPEHPLVLSRHQDRIDVQANPALEQILAEYAADVLAEGHAVSRKWPYTYGALGDGTQLDSSLRALYDAFTDDQERRGRQAPSPFDIEGVQVFDNWLKAQAPGALPGINRALAHVYLERTDLRAAYPDLAGPGGAGLIAWAHDYGRREVPLLARVLAETKGGGPMAGGDDTPEPPLEPAQPLRDGPWGTNVVGRFGDQTETGYAAGAIVGALDATGILAVPIQSHGPPVPRTDGSYLTAALQDAPFPVNVLIMDGDELREFVREAGRQFFAGRYSIGLWFSELGRLPDGWRASLSLLEEVWVPSRYVAAAVEPVAMMPVTTMPIPVTGPPFELRSRDQLDLPGRRFRFLSVVDNAASVEYSNPLGAIEAFRSAVSPNDEAELVIRWVASEHDAEERERVLAAAADAGAMVIDRTLSPAEERSLIATCDCVISLHRAVAFGLTMAEAMWHAKPVIATGYSGNLEFMNESNSLLVDHTLVALADGSDSPPDDAIWAQPDVGHAATRIREVLDDRSAAAALGARAAAEIRRSHSPAAAGEAMVRRLESIRATGRARLAVDDMPEMSPAVGAMPLRVQQAAGRGAAPGRGQRLRQIARQGVLRLMRPVTIGQLTINEGFIAALMELNSAIVELRRDDAGKRAGLLAQLRHYERLMPIADAEVSGIGEIKRILTLQTDREVYLALSELGRRHALIGPAPGAPPELTSLAGNELRVFSQNGEDGVLTEILRRIGAPTRYFIEFGVESGREGNCVYLADVAGWRGLFLEPDERFFAQLASKYAAQTAVTAVPEAVTPANAEQLFMQAGAPTELDVLSIDVDGQDYWIWEAIESFRPRVVVVEYNSALDPRRRLVQPNEPERTWDGTDYFGASLGALRALGERKGYRLVHTELSGANAFFVREDLASSAFPPAEEVAQRGIPNYFQSGYHHPPAPSGGRYLDLDTGRQVHI